MVQPRSEWIDDWRIGLAPSRERRVSRELLNVFSAFWKSERMDEKSATTKSRYSAGLHALGGYIVAQAASPEERDTALGELLARAIEHGEGPLIYHDNEAWQRELDTVCRKVHKYLTRQRR
jgi:hypothetical protein